MSEQQLDELMSEAFETDHPAMMDYVNLKFKLKRLEAENRELREDMRLALEVLFAAPELNMSNYDHDQVAELNTAAIEAFQILEEALQQTNQETK